MNANKLKKFLLDLEKEIKPYNRTLKDVDVNFRYSENSDVYRVNTIENDLYDSEKNKIVESNIQITRKQRQLQINPNLRPKYLNPQMH